MFEMTVSTIKARNKDISFIIDKLRPAIKSLRGIMVCEEFDGRVKLALAVNEDKKDYVLSFVFDAVSEAIVRSYKEEYLKKHLKVASLNRVAHAAFIKTLTMFDKAEDKALIKKQLHACTELNIDSLYNFRLWELEKRWKEICELVKENSSYLLASNSFYELMRFLITTADIETSVVRLSVENEHIVAKLDDNKQLFKFKMGNGENFRICVLGELISSSPEKIIIESDIGEELTSLIKSLFDERVNMNIKKC